MAKPKNLSNIKIKEVSMVDLPANKQPFVFFKRQGEQSEDSLNKQKKIKIVIESNGLVGGTKVSVNDDDLGKLRSFDFSFYGDDPKQAIHASYSKVAESEDGFSRTETYYLTKGKPMDEKTLKALKAYLGTDDIDIEKKVDEEEIQKAITLITEHYKEAFPEDLENAVGVIAKRAASSYAVKDDKDVSKAGARLSKDMIKKLKAIIEALTGLIPAESQSTEKADGGDETSELSKQLAELKDAVTKLNPTKKDDNKTDVAELTKQLKEVSDSVKALEKDGATKKGITGDDNDDDDEPKGAGENGKVLWKSLQPKKK